MQQLEFRAMGSAILAAVDSNNDEAGALLAQVPAWFEEWEQAMSRFRVESELSLLNSRAGRSVQVSPTLFEVLALALTAARDTGGLVNPAVLTALEGAGYTHSFDAMQQNAALTSFSLGAMQAHKTPRAATALDAPGSSIWKEIKLDRSRLTVQTPPEARLDLGGIAKGWAAHKACEMLSVTGPALVDAGGDIAVSGPMQSGEPWPIGIADPLNSEDDLELLAIAGGGVATSGRDYRKWMMDGTLRHHIIDPRTGRPAETDLISVTVIAPSVSQAEVAAKAVLILGSAEGLRWIEARPQYAALLVYEDGKTTTSKQMSSFIWGSAQSLQN